MAMKKKFLGLAMAAMVALPATGVYAAGNTTTGLGNPQVIEGEEGQTLNHEIKVTGEVRRADGSAAAGKIEVELPTTMAFAVNDKSNLTGASYTVDNRSGCGIDVSVSGFTKTTGDITVKPMTEMDDEEKLKLLDRSNVALELKGTDGGTQTNVDLGKIMKDGVETKVLNIANNSSETMTLSGVAGKKEVKDVDAPSGVDKDGARADFTLVFKIKKDNKN